MARMVIFTDAMSERGRQVAINADLVQQAYDGGQINGTPCTTLFMQGEDESIWVIGNLQTVAAMLTSPAERGLSGGHARSIDTVHLTGWVLDPNHPDRRYRLHPSILTDDQPPAWAAKPAQPGGDS